MHNRQALSPNMLWETLKEYASSDTLHPISKLIANQLLTNRSYHMWPIYLIGLSWLIPTNPMTSYLTLQLRSIGFDTFQTNLLTIPAYVLFIIQLLFWTWLSERYNERFLIGLLSQVWALPLLIALELIPVTTSHWAKWTLSTLMVGHPYVHAILVAITSRNAGAVRTRTVASALYNMCVQASSIIAQNIYRDNDKPMYRKGNKVLIGICTYNFAIFIGAKFYYVYVNKKRTAVWDKMDKSEKESYLETTTDKGNKR